VRNTQTQIWLCLSNIQTNYNYAEYTEQKAPKQSHIKKYLKNNNITSNGKYMYILFICKQVKINSHKHFSEYEHFTNISNTVIFYFKLKS